MEGVEDIVFDLNSLTGKLRNPEGAVKYTHHHLWYQCKAAYMMSVYPPHDAYAQLRRSAFIEP